MPLSLEIKPSVVQEEKIPTYSELLLSEIRFKETYQSFLDYKNMCEIVVKAQTSQECLAFANDLFNTDVRNIQVSIEGLKSKLKAAWDAFVVWLKKLINGFKNLKSIIGLTPLPVTVDISRENLKNLYTFLSDIDKIKKDQVVQAARESLGEDFQKEKIGTKADLSEWINMAQTTLTILNVIVLKKEKSDSLGTITASCDEDIAVMRIILTQGKQVAMRLSRSLVKMKKVEKKVK